MPFLPFLLRLSFTKLKCGRGDNLGQTLCDNQRSRGLRRKCSWSTDYLKTVIPSIDSFGNLQTRSYRLLRHHHLLYSLCCCTPLCTQAFVLAVEAITSTPSFSGEFPFKFPCLPILIVLILMQRMSSLLKKCRLCFFVFQFLFPQHSPSL